MMDIHVTPERMIRDIQDDFTETYPFLRIAFFFKGQWYAQGSWKKRSVDTKQVIGCIISAIAENGFWITPAMTVFDLEKKCDELFGLSVQVYRRSGKIWLETTMTYNWTIAQQNKSGCELTRVMSRQ